MAHDLTHKPLPRSTFLLVQDLRQSSLQRILVARHLVVADSREITLLAETFKVVGAAVPTEDHLTVVAEEGQELEIWEEGPGTRFHRMRVISNRSFLLRPLLDLAIPFHKRSLSDRLAALL